MKWFFSQQGPAQFELVSFQYFWRWDLRRKQYRRGKFQRGRWSWRAWTFHLLSAQVCLRRRLCCQMLAGRWRVGCRTSFLPSLIQFACLCRRSDAIPEYIIYLNFILYGKKIGNLSDLTHCVVNKTSSFAPVVYRHSMACFVFTNERGGSHSGIWKLQIFVEIVETWNAICQFLF